MSHGQRSCRNVFANLDRQPQKANDVGDRRPVFTYGLRDLLLREMELIRPAGVYAVASSMGLRSSRWRFSMSAAAKHPIVRDIAHDDRDFEQPGPLRRAPAALAGNDSVTVLGLAHDDGLNHAVLSGSSARALRCLAIVHRGDAAGSSIRREQVERSTSSGRGLSGWCRGRVRDERAQAAHRVLGVARSLLLPGEDSDVAGRSARFTDCAALRARHFAG